MTGGRKEKKELGVRLRNVVVTWWVGRNGLITLYAFVYMNACVCVCVCV